MIMIVGITIGMKVELKYGSPTDILFLDKASTINGYIVPRNTEEHMTTISMLFNNIDPSLLRKWIKFLSKNFLEDNTNRINEYEPIIPINKRMYIPLDGSKAKVWTLVSIPDLTKNVPIVLSRKESIAKSKTHF